MEKSGFDRVFWRAVIFVALAVIVFIVYGATLLNGFVYDDNHQVLANAWIRDISNIPAIFTSSNWEFRSGGSNIYRPVFQLFLLAEYHLFGLKSFGYHLVNVFLHAVNALLVYAVAVLVFSSVGRGVTQDGGPAAFRDGRLWAFVAALVFALHPVNSEPVAWVSALPELAYTAFVLFALYLYASSRKYPYGYYLSIPVFFIALLTKETAVAFLLLVIAFDYAIKGRALVAGWRRYLPYAGAVFAYAVIRYLAIGGFIYKKHATLSLYEAATNAPPLLLQYFLKLVFPAGLSAIYVFYPAHSILEPKVFVALFALAVVAIAIIRYRRVGAVFLGALWIIIPLLPVLYVPALAASPFAERYLYLPSAGFAIIVSYGLWKLCAYSYARLGVKGAGYVKVLQACVVLILIACATASALRARAWESDFTLWSDAVAKAPDSTHAHYNLAWLYHGMGEYDNAIRHYRESLRLDPSGADAHYNVGLIYLEMRMFDEAAFEFRAALSIDPGYADARRRLETLLRLEEKNDGG